MIFFFPSNFTSKNVHKIWIEVSKTSGPAGITIDLSNLIFVDPEGTNYITLLPYLFKNRYTNVQIILPPRDRDVYSYLNDCGVFKILAQDFTIIDVGLLDFYGGKFSFNQTNSYYSNKYVPLFQTYVFDSKEQRKIFFSLSENYEIFKRNINLSERATKCLSELIFNVYDHSEQNFCCITIHFRNVGKLRIPYLFICVSDLGIGIKRSFIKSDRYSKFIYKRKGDNYYILAAVTEGISSTNLRTRGFGLPLVLRNTNKLIISSGFCRTSFTKDDNDISIIKKYNINRIRKMQGTSIVALIKGHEIS